MQAQDLKCEESETDIMSAQPGFGESIPCILSFSHSRIYCSQNVLTSGTQAIAVSRTKE